MASRGYLLSLPERVIRSALGVSAGLVREMGDVVIPRSVRRSQLYRSLVETTLRYVIEEVGGAKGLYPAAAPQAPDFLARRAAGHAVELLGIVAFRVSPVWVLAALADLSGLGRRLIPEIAEALKEAGLLEKDARFENVEQLLDGLEKSSARLAQTINAPPLDVAALRTEWTEIRTHVRAFKPDELPPAKAIISTWDELKGEASRQGSSIFQTSSVLAISALRTLPDRARWLYSSTRVGARRTGKLFAATIMDDYGQTLAQLREAGYLTYAKRQLSPYLRACAEQFSRQQRTLTERLIEKARRSRSSRRRDP